VIEGRRRAFRGRSTSPADRAAASQAGLPNVLSNAAEPNRLSIEEPPGAGPVGGTMPGTLKRVARPSRQAGPSSAGRRQLRVRIPGQWTLIFIVFVGITIFRLIGAFGDESSTEPGPTSGPGVTTSERPVTQPGIVEFGTAVTEDCGLEGQAAIFAPGTGVWWTARLSALQPADAGALVVLRRDGRVVERIEVPADESLGEWDVLCSSQSSEQLAGGTYRLEVWNADSTTLLAAGEYVLTS
jgi:hypothetical protein